jgi:hypothetical protein
MSRAVIKYRRASSAGRKDAAGTLGKVKLAPLANYCDEPLRLELA